MNETFFPIKEKLDALKKDVEEIELLFKNCWYNFNRIRERKKEMEENLRINPKVIEDLKKWRKTIDLPDKIIELYVTIWEDIIVFEFHSFLTNVMRTTNFLANFTLKNKAGWEISRKFPTTKEFIEKPRYEGMYYRAEMKREFDIWIEEVNKKRGEIIHKIAEKKMQGSFSVTAKWDNKDNVDLTKNITIGILDITDLEGYWQDKKNKVTSSDTLKGAASR
mgnify:CR=1 FL=1